MRSMIIIALMTLSGVLAQAAGRQQASEICTSMSFDSSRNACISAIGKYDYFEQAAIDICKGMSFDSGKSECILNIGNKSYDAYETANCANNSFDSNKNLCLKNAGRPAQLRPLPPVPGCMSKQDILFELQDLDRLVYQNENARARSAIYNLINNLQRCP